MRTPASPIARQAAAHLALLLTALAPASGQPGATPKPPPVPSVAVARDLGYFETSAAGWKPIIIAERDGQLWAQLADSMPLVRVESSGSSLRFSKQHAVDASNVGRVGGRLMAFTLEGARFTRRPLGPESGNQLVVKPVRPLADLRREALAASPPAEANRDATPDLAELVTLDRTIRLEIRYATTNNLFGTRFYSQPRAFLQRPAAQALARVNASLEPYGVGLLVHDGYRPWYVTKMFWDAAAPEVRPFVANPAEGSKHNRGAAVDLSLYDRRTGRPVEMPSTYDETTPRASPDWPGGTSRQRWYRDLLRRSMEAQGFTVFALEWWHFDYTGWEHYPIMNIPFERLGAAAR